MKQPSPVSLQASLERQALAARLRLVEEGALVTQEALLTGLGISEQDLGTAVRTGRMFSLEIGTAQYYPAFYLSAAPYLRQLEAVTKMLGDLPGGSKWQFLTQPKGSLGNMTPLQALELGQVAQVKNSARAFAER